MPKNSGTRFFFKKLLNFYINSSIHVAMALSALIYSTYIQKNIPLNDTYIKCIFLGTITGYNFVKYAPITKLYHKNLSSNLRIIQLFSLGVIIAFTYYFYKLSNPTKLILTSIGLVTVLYTVPIGIKRNLRSYTGVKIYIVAICWSLTSSITPIYTHYEHLHFDDFLLFIQHFIFVSALIIPFDIRDLNYDPKKLRTLPQVLGIRKAKILSILLFVGFYIIDSYRRGIVNSFDSLITMLLFTTLVYLQDHQKNSNYYCALYIEAVPIFYLGVQLCFHFLQR